MITVLFVNGITVQGKTNWVKVRLSRFSVASALRTGIFKGFAMICVYTMIVSQLSCIRFPSQPCCVLGDFRVVLPRSESPTSPHGMPSFGGCRYQRCSQQHILERGSFPCVGKSSIICTAVFGRLYFLNIYEDSPL